MTVLGWFELPDEDVPPESIWLDDDAIRAWFEQVRNKNKAGLSSDQPMEKIPIVDNDDDEIRRWRR